MLDNTSFNNTLLSLLSSYARDEDRFPTQAELMVGFKHAIIEVFNGETLSDSQINSIKACAAISKSEIFNSELKPKIKKLAEGMLVKNPVGYEEIISALARFGIVYEDKSVDFIKRYLK